MAANGKEHAYLDRHFREVVWVAQTSGDVELEVLAELHNVVTQADVLQVVLHTTPTAFPHSVLVLSLLPKELFFLFFQKTQSRNK